jgi:NagD protein
MIVSGKENHKLYSSKKRRKPVDLRELRRKKAFICDMDGVIYHGNRVLAGVRNFVDFLKRENKQFLFLTNSSQKSPRELQQKLSRMGIKAEESHFYTSALATAFFLKSQKPRGTAYVIGDAGLINALYDAGFSMNDINPDYVVVGESQTYNMETVVKASNLVLKGASLIGTNPDVSGPIEKGITPATGALISPIELATKRKAYFVGKPNPLMMRHALKLLGSNPQDTVIVGDRLDTDIIAGIESEIDTVLVLSGVTSLEDVKMSPYKPSMILQGVGEISG